MGFISDIETELMVSISFYSNVVVVIDGVPQPATGVLVDTVYGLFWTGVQNISFISDKLKTSVDGAIAIDHNSLIASMADDSYFIVDGKKYQILHVENVGEQSEVLQIMYKRDVGN